MMVKGIRCVFGLMLGAPAYAIAASLPSVADFASFPAFEQVSISPKGDYIAAKIHLKDEVGLAVIRLKDNAVTTRLSLGENRDLYRYWWAGPNRLIVEPALYYGTLEQPERTGELMAVNADGSDQTYLYGYEGTSETGALTRKVTRSFAAASVIKTLPDDPEHVIVAINDFYSNADTAITVSQKLNVSNGLLSDRVAAPRSGYSSLLADWTGAIRYAVTPGPSEFVPLTFKREGSGAWTAINTGDAKNAHIVPLRFSRDNKRVFLRSDETGDKACLVEQTLESNERHVLSCDPVADLEQVIYSFDGREAIAALYANDKPHLVVLDGEHGDGLMLRRLQQSFPGYMVVPVSSTNDGSKVVLRVFSDRDPGGWYLFEPKISKASPLVAQRDWVVPEQMGERRPIQFPARDGTVIHGYLTLPPGFEKATDLPLVVHPHGGPVGISDDWQWEPLPQLLATRGYAVLQVNYRGSSGYGNAFLAAGKHSWGGVMIDDITDAVRWTQSQGITDPKRVCIFGGSYGGYAALMSAVREPDMYRCVVGYAGVYDLPLMRSDSDISDSKHGRDYIAEYVGADPAELREASPIQHLDQLKAAVMIIHGEEDQRAPFNQAKALRKALDARNYPYEWLAKPGEGHGFYSATNRTEMEERLLAFLDRSIGKGAIPKAN